MECWEGEKYKEGYFYRGTKKMWQWIQYGFFPRALGDLIYITLRMIIETHDKSDWAVKAFLKCSALLEEGKRWPDYMQEQHKQYIARNIFHKWWIELKNRKKIMRYKRTGEYNEKDVPLTIYRPQTSMTRDPWIMMYCCAIHLGLYSHLKKKPQWWLYDPKVWEWIKALNKQKNCYILMEKISSKPKKDYVRVLNDYMKRTYKMVA